jgi:hypothetical protein
MGSRLLWAALVVMGTVTSGVGILAAQARDSSTQVLRGIIEALPPAAAVRLGIGPQRWTGRLAGSPPNALTLTDETGIRKVTLSDIDTLWVRGPRKHEGLTAGAALGALVFVTLQLSDGSGLQRAGRARQGFMIILGTAMAGMILDGIADPWVAHFPP